jgi:hypothetical protein
MYRIGRLLHLLACPLCSTINVAAEFLGWLLLITCGQAQRKCDCCCKACRRFKLSAEIKIHVVLLRIYTPAFSRTDAVVVAVLRVPGRRLLYCLPITPSTTAVMAMTRSTKNRIFAISAAPAAMPPKPRTAAIMKNTAA